MRSRAGLGYVSVGLVSAPVFVGALYSTAAAVGLTGAGASGFGVARLIKVLSDAETWSSLGWTLYTAGVATVLSLAGALLVSVVLQRSRLGRALAVIPMAVPHVAAALAALLLLGQSGLLARLAFAIGWIAQPADFPALVYDRPGIALILSFAWKEFPFLTLTAWAVLHAAGSSLDETARTLGADARTVFRRVTWPVLWRGCAPATIAVFAFLLGQYEMASLLAPSDPLPFAVLSYERAHEPELARRGEAHVLGLLALLLTVALVALHERLRVRSPLDDAMYDA